MVKRKMVSVILIVTLVVALFVFGGCDSGDVNEPTRYTPPPLPEFTHIDVETLELVAKREESASGLEIRLFGGIEEAGHLERLEYKIIYTLCDLNKVRYNMTSNFLVANRLCLGLDNESTERKPFEMIAGVSNTAVFSHFFFTGIFNGNNHLISDIYLVRSMRQSVARCGSVALFYGIAQLGIVRNLVLDIEVYNFVSTTGNTFNNASAFGVVVRNSGKIENVVVKGLILGSDLVAGIARESTGIITNVRNYALVKARHNYTSRAFAAGIAASNLGLVEYALNIGTVLGYRAFGIVGLNKNENGYAIIRNSVNYGDIYAVWAQQISGSFAGGVWEDNLQRGRLRRISDFVG
ncbi:MAG: hypothetical protein FWB72_06295 [Firmicutes bacterium]|nr:hypothetical protein [Bacillota bacterium]